MFDNPEDVRDRSRNPCALIKNELVVISRLVEEGRGHFPQFAKLISEDMVIKMFEKYAGTIESFAKDFLVLLEAKLAEINEKYASSRMSLVTGKQPEKSADGEADSTDTGFTLYKLAGFGLGYPRAGGRYAYMLIRTF